ncbi:TIGR04086 family membrane protein [Aquimarina sp. M1]
METVITNVNNTKQRFSRISWGGVLAGTLTTLTVLILLSLLGLGIGMTTIDPMTEQHPLSGLGTGTIIWWIVTNLVAIFIGGMVAARSSGLPSNTDGAVHGFLSWGLSLLISILLVTSTLGSILSGAGTIISSIFGDSTAENIAEQINMSQKDSQKATDITLQSVKSELFQLINKGEKYNIIPEGTASEARQELGEVQSESRQALRQLEIDDMIENFVNDVKIDLDRNGDLDIRVAGNRDYINKEEITTYLTNNTDLSKQEINGVITKWDRKIDEVVETVKKQYAEVKSEVQEITEETTDAAGKYGIIAFVILLLGALAGFFGGATASPHYTVNEEHRADLINDELS